MTSSSLSIPKRVLIIGGGPTGLVALRNLKERGDFDRVELYERRDNIGGVWCFDKSDTNSAYANPPRWPSPAYSGLIGNVLPEFLSFSEFPFPEPPSTPVQPFPTLTETHEYLLNFAEPYFRSGLIKLNREVIRVMELENGKGWSITVKDWGLETGETVEELWDAVVVAVGWYDHPVWPDTEGLNELKARGLAKHAKWWRGPQQFAGKKVLVVGNANSAKDIDDRSTACPLANGVVYRSVRRKAFPGFPSLPDDRIQMVAPVAKYTLKTTASSGDCGCGEKFDALLEDGTLLSDLDAAHIGTGYRPFPDLVDALNRNAGGGDLSEPHVPLVSESTHPQRVPSLHRLIMYAYNPSLGFVGAPMAYTPFSVADVACTWLALAWRGETPVPSTCEGWLVFEQERLASIERWRKQMENPSSLMVYNVLGGGEQEYAQGLKADIVQARPKLGALLPDWNEARTKLREAMYKVKYKALEYARDHHHDDARAGQLGNAA